MSSDVKKNNITIGITAYNEGELLIESWNSVLKQLDDCWEAIMILDGGADSKTKEVFDNIFHLNLKKIKIEGNKGPYYSRTLAINETKTQWYCHLDADDYLDCNFTKILNNAIDKHPSAEIFFGDIKYISNSNQKVISFKDVNIDLVPYKVNGHVPIKRAIFNEIGGFEKTLFDGGADRDFLFKCGLKNKKFIYIPDIIFYNCRKRQNSVGESRKKNNNQREKIFYYFNSNYRKYLEDIKCYDAFIKKSFKPLISRYYYSRNYLKLLLGLLKYGHRADFFLWKYVGRLIFKIR